jgi:prolyl-tRNA synthetase
MKLSRIPQADPQNGHGAFRVLLSVLNTDDEEVMQSAEILYRQLQAHGLSVLMDDRHVSSDEKLSTASAVQVPLHLLIGSKGLLTGVVDLIDRSNHRKYETPLEEAVEKAVELANGR